jgi:hypothetical protein
MHRLGMRAEHNHYLIQPGRAYCFGDPSHHGLPIDRQKLFDLAHPRRASRGQHNCRYLYRSPTRFHGRQLYHEM